MLTVSIQYITQPIAVFQEVGRILRPAVHLWSSSRTACSRPKRAIWRMLDDQKHVDLIAAYFHHAGNFAGIEAHNWSPSAYTDPVYVVLARKPSA